MRKKAVRPGAFVRDLPELLVKNGLGLPYENVPREELFKREPVF